MSERQGGGGQGVVEAQARRAGRDDALEAVQRAVGHAFGDPSWLEQALTHTSYRNEVPGVDVDNERLEFLGDAVLELTVSEALFRRWPDFPEGRLTRLRASLVNTRTLADVSRALGLGRALRLGRGEEVTGGRDRRSTLADAFEATLGAVYLDGGLEAARAFVERALMPRMDALARRDGRDSKTLLQEWAQEHHRVVPSYEIIGHQGPDHDLVFTARVTVAGVGEADGEGRTKKEAHRAAAAALLVAAGVEGAPVGRDEAAGETRDGAPQGGDRDETLDGEPPAA